MNNCTSHQV